MSPSSLNLLLVIYTNYMFNDRIGNGKHYGRLYKAND